MNYLGLDYGRKKVGLSIGNRSIAEPYLVIRYANQKDLIKKIKDIIKKEDINKVVVGVSENEMGQESKSFADLLGADIFDETLTSQDAIRLSIQGGVKRKKRKGMEDAFAATIMLQNYLDSQ